MSNDSNGKRLAHTVFFTLNDACDEACERLVAACKKHLTDHPGTLFFAAGRRAAEYVRPVNDQTFDVSLHLVFEDRAAHDAYQVAPRHDEFIAENKENWKQVRVFDALLND
ncbi:MAG: Dabb family protein [Planctomycetales bacterium]|nr:Dabb family protein [Planctomycetales bacterium]